ncbi:hypothetical protein DL764_006156 [Monosporascus ibericus]|uniref:Uncharacterized protein n=1 Tax=Monosporascus ibericus TaxID=155417 RepID=A0A4Q4T5I0_9PEZI|nr:hypothetical protein DL764_006156 [Monosporascus ibericus]
MTRREVTLEIRYADANDDDLVNGMPAQCGENGPGRGGRRRNIWLGGNSYIGGDKNFWSPGQRLTPER